MKIAEPGMKSLRAGDFKAGNGSSRNNELPSGQQRERIMVEEKYVDKCGGEEVEEEMKVKQGQYDSE
ncbi:hypothetical protein I79_016570 [Cricetulus griseus]|uniref:Uncharacterized protein n=1 Tax=Cricetulus griseus TaxID=10029 RepID=G3HZR1_CRIGR|nr:hypothetical protein I79_016570 [Cricetulus griseus]